jgi:hypothetical protein
MCDGFVRKNRIEKRGKIQRKSWYFYVIGRLLVLLFIQGFSFFLLILFLLEGACYFDAIRLLALSAVAGRRSLFMSSKKQ